MNSDRLFIKKFDNFVYALRNIVYFGNAKKSTAAPDPKHDRLRFINYFGSESNEQYYDSSSYTLDFANDARLKDEFAAIYTYKTMLVEDMGDALQLFAALDDTYRQAKELVGTRSLDHFSTQVNKHSELAQSGSLLVKGEKPYYFKRNTDPADGFTDEDKEALLTALDFAIKKNNFTSFASTYKKLLSCRDGLENADCGVAIDHQLFHPIFDELHVWSVAAAMTECLTVRFTYIINGAERFEFSDILPLKLVYDNLYGRSYLLGWNGATNDFSVFRFDRIFSVTLSKKEEEPTALVAERRALAAEKRALLEQRLATAWLVSLNENTEHVTVRFRNTVALRERVKNEGRHGRITAFGEDSFVYEIDVNDPLEMVNWILNFGSDCVVTEPPVLIDKIIAHLEGMAK